MHVSPYNKCSTTLGRSLYTNPSLVPYRFAPLLFAQDTAVKPLLGSFVGLQLAMERSLFVRTQI